MRELPELIKVFQPIAKKTWLPILTEDTNHDLITSGYMVDPLLLPDEDWPCCGACGKEMACLLQLDLNSAPDGRFGNDGYLQLFYCVTDEGRCAIENGAYQPFVTIGFEDTEKVAKLVRIIHSDEYKQRQLSDANIALNAKMIAGWNEQVDLPSFSDSGFSDDNTISRLSIAAGATYTNISLAFYYPRDSIKDQDKIEETYRESEVREDKLGGYPQFMQQSRVPSCPQCKATMEMVYLLSDDNLGINLFGDSGLGRIWQCGYHKDTLAFEWDCA